MASLDGQFDKYFVSKMKYFKAFQLPEKAENALVSFTHPFLQVAA